MDTSSTGFVTIINFFFFISTTNAAPGFLGLDTLLQGPRYHTQVELEKVTFLHFTRNPTGQTTEYNDVTKDFSRLDSSLPLVIILHGFMGSPHAKSTQFLIEGYVNKGKSNVIGVNWTDLAKGPWYGVAAERSYDAAKQLAEWMNDLVAANITKWENIHIVGFSLGAQVAGLTSKYIPNSARVGRLTGLDPARPMFDDKTHEDHLDADDSDFTTVVHTCGGFLAVPEPRGHVDFYPNGGENPQPPCSEELLTNILHTYVDSPSSKIDPSDRGPTKIFAGLVCSHYMALALWVESLKSGSKFMAKPCQSWQNYVNNTCDVTDSTEVEMGENTPQSTRGIYYLKTPAKVPYADTLNVLIADGIEEYSKILISDSSDHGHGEIEEVTPEIQVMIGNSNEHSHNKGTDHTNDDNRIDLPSSSSRNTCNNFYTLVILLVLSLLRLK